MDRKIEVRMYPDERTMNDALVRYIKENVIYMVDNVSFVNDKERYDIIPCNRLKGELEWYGEMDGIMFTDPDMSQVIFASWFDPDNSDEFDEYFDRVMSAMMMFSSEEEISY